MTVNPPRDLAPAELFSLEGKTAIITGASSGLGERFARTVHRAGASVIIAARRAERLESLTRDLGERATAVTCDVADEENCRALIDAAAGSVDILINNAGIGRSVAAEVEPLASWQQTIDVNLTGVFMLSQLAGRLMLERGRGSIINIASILGLVAGAPLNQAAYCASKGAVVNLTRELACQWAARGVRVNALAPGWFPSEMTSEGLLDDERSRSFLDRNTPMRRPGRPDELDGAILFLASDASSFVTGTTLVVDGGWTAR